MFLENAGKKLYYDDIGVEQSGEPTLLFVHGWMASSSVWREQVSHFSKNRRVVTFDLTGFGQSAKPNDITYTPDIWLDDIDQLIEHLNIKKPILIGWSMGGALGISYAVSRPEALSKMVLVGSTALLVAPPEDFEPAIPPESAEYLLTALHNDFSVGSRGFVEMMFPEINSEQLKNEIHAISQQTTVSIALESIGNIGSTDLRPMLNQIQVPTLILQGEDDAVCSLGAGLYLAEMIPNTQFDIFLGKGHAPFLTDAQAFNHRLTAFL